MQGRVEYRVKYVKQRNNKRESKWRQTNSRNLNVLTKVLFFGKGAEALPPHTMSETVSMRYERAFFATLS